MSVKKGEEMDSAICTMHGDLVFTGIDTNKAERWYMDQKTQQKRKHAKIFSPWGRVSPQRRVPTANLARIPANLT